MRILPLLLLCLLPCPGGPDASGLIGTWDDVTPERPRPGYRLQRPAVSLTFEGNACTWESAGSNPGNRSSFPWRRGSIAGSTS